MDKAAACDVIVIVSTTVGFELGGSYPLKVINCIIFIYVTSRALYNLCIEL